MEHDELLFLDTFKSNEDKTPVSIKEPVQLEKRKERLAAIILGG